MTFFEKNSAFLISQGFEEQVLQQPLESSSVRLFTGKMGYYTATKHLEGHNILLHSVYDPMAESLKLIPGEYIATYPSHFLFGLGLGYSLITLLEHTPPSSLIFVLETDWDIIRAAMYVIDFEEILATGRVVLAFGELSEIRIVLDNLFVIGEIMLKLQRINFWNFAPKYRTESAAVLEMQRLVLEMIEYNRCTVGPDLNFAVQGLSNLVEHIPYLIKTPFVRQIVNTWHKPVVIVLAGPSLAKNIAVLKEWQDQVTIFCVNTVFNKLLDYGIIPDATFSLDRAPVIPEVHYKRNQPIPESIVFVANPVVDPRSARLFQHHLFLLGGGEYYQVELAEDLGSGTSSTGLSVTHFAFAFARQIGAPAIILVGQDLALGPEGQTHSSGSVYDGVKEATENNPSIVELDGYYGEKVLSTRSWRTFLNWYEIQLEILPFLVINATEGGAKIKGTVQMTLQEAMETHVGVGAAKKDSFAEWLNVVSQDIRPGERIAKIKESFTKRIKKLKIDEQYYSRAAGLYDHISDTDIPLQSRMKYHEQMYKIAHDDILGNTWIYPIFRPKYITEMGKYLNLQADDNEEPETTMICTAKILHDMFEDMCLFMEKLKQLLEKAIEDIERTVS